MLKMFVKDFGGQNMNKQRLKEILTIFYEGGKFNHPTQERFDEMFKYYCKEFDLEDNK